MKISTKGRYALRLMMDLAENNDGTNISLKDVSNRLNISLKYLEQIISILNKADFVISVRGSNGGYRLSRDPKEYTVGDILRLTEGSLSVTVCTEDEVNQCEKYCSCPTVGIWNKINQAISDVVDNITLDELVKGQKESLEEYYV